MSRFNDTHLDLISAVQEYIRAQDKFETSGTYESCIRAREALLEIRRLAALRRKEMFVKRAEFKESRKGRPGRPPKIHS